jgi:23S rRNA pseudouridine2605 synthase
MDPYSGGRRSSFGGYRGLGSLGGGRLGDRGLGLGGYRGLGSLGGGRLGDRGLGLGGYRGMGSLGGGAGYGGLGDRGLGGDQSDSYICPDCGEDCSRYC